MVFSRMDKWELTKPDPYLYLQLFAITANTFPLGMCLCSRFLEVELLGHLKYWDKLTSRKTLPISSPTSVFKNSHFSTSLQRIDISKRLKSFPTRMSTKWSFSLSSLSPYSSYFSFSFHMCSWCLDPPNKAWHPRCAYHPRGRNWVMWGGNVWVRGPGRPQWEELERTHSFRSGASGCWQGGWRQVGLGITRPGFHSSPALTFLRLGPFSPVGRKGPSMHWLCYSGEKSPHCSELQFPFLWN